MLTYLRSVFLLALVGLFSGCAGEAAGPNRAPVARGPGDQLTRVGVAVLLDGGESFDPDGDSLIFRWELLAAPSGGAGGLTQLGEPVARLEPDASGVYMVGLTVCDGLLLSNRDVVRVLVFGGCTGDDDCADPADWCDGRGVCRDGQCVIEARDCSDGNPCTQDLCDEELDTCQNPPVSEPPADEGLVHPGTCGDGVDNDCDGLTDGQDPACVAECTENDQCDDLNPCTQDSCSQEGLCENTPVTDGTACDDGLWCNGNETCRSGTCTNGVPVDCSHLDDQCNTGICSDSQQDCLQDPEPDGTECGLRYCSGSDFMMQTCQSGSCSGSQLVEACGGGDVCGGTGTCDPVAGCQAGTPAPDGTPCTPEPGPGVEDCGYQCLSGVCSEPPYARTAQLCDPADARLVGCYSFDGDQPVGTQDGVIDGSSHGNHGTATGLSYVLGLDNQAVQYQLAGEIHVPDSASLDCGQAVTVEAWIRPASLPVTGRMGVLDNAGQYALFLYDQNRMRCSAGNTLYAESPPAGQWSHVAFTVDTVNDEIIIYLDGQPAASNIYDINISTSSTGDMTIGCDSPGGQSFDGDIDSVRVWNTALSADEICWSAVR